MKTKTGKARIPIVMKTWAGPEPHDFEYISQSIPSLLASDLPRGAELVIFDDHSSNSQLLSFLERLEKNDSRVRVIFRESNNGPNLGQQEAYDFVETEYPDAPYYLNVDDDVIYHRNWVNALVEAQRNFQKLGMTGVFTALNMPFRKPHSVVFTEGRKYLLQWKQPALNWMIPREVYEDVGRFKDEGIAYDTVYSHWMRLKNYSVICLVPSYVQNIGLLGAYAQDDTTTSRDFIGEGAGYSARRRVVHMARYSLNRIPGYLQRLVDSSAKRLFPIRWGSEFVYEGMDQGNQPVAAFSVDEAIQFGWSREGVARRAVEIQQAQAGAPDTVTAIRRSLRGKATWIECGWTFRPNLREYRRLELGSADVDPGRLFCSLIEQLIPMHSKNVVHNKIRQENVYVDAAEGKYRLVWYGTEPPHGACFPESDSELIDSFSRALNRWALPSTREQFATGYLEALAPEVINGEAPTPGSDLFSAAALACLIVNDPIATLSEMRILRERWKNGDPENVAAEHDRRLSAVLRRCLAFDPTKRPNNALEVGNMLNV